MPQARRQHLRTLRIKFLVNAIETRLMHSLVAHSELPHCNIKLYAFNTRQQAVEMPLSFAHADEYIINQASLTYSQCFSFNLV